MRPQKDACELSEPELIHSCSNSDDEESNSESDDAQYTNPNHSIRY